MSDKSRPARIIAADQGDWSACSGGSIRQLIGGVDSDEAYALTILRVAPGKGIPVRRSVREEGLYVIRGELTFEVGNRTFGLPAGGFAGVAAGTVYRAENPAAEEAEILVVSSPTDREPPNFEAEADATITSEDFGATPDLTLRLPGEGHSIAVVGDLYRFLATSSETRGRYAIWHATVPPGGGPPPHVHSREEEGFFMLEGSLTFFVEGTPTQAGPGTTLHLPRGVEHAFRNEGDQPARMLILVAPGGMEAMFERTGIPWPEDSGPTPPPGREEIERLLCFAPEYGVEIRIPHAH